jgi:hypothetical protein
MKRCVTSIVRMALIGVVLAGCASLPPKAATDLKAIAGTWVGWLVLPGGARVDATNTIREDGTWENVIPAATTGSRFVGRVTVQDGKYRWKSETSGRTGTQYILHEGEGRRCSSIAPPTGATENTPR